MKIKSVVELKQKINLWIFRSTFSEFKELFKLSPHRFLADEVELAFRRHNKYMKKNYPVREDAEAGA